MKNILYFNFVPGTRNGLSLLLNVEQYEHMRGPQNDAGVKVSNILSNCNISTWEVLRMMLVSNNKQYEKIRGSQKDAGVKVNNILSN